MEQYNRGSPILVEVEFKKRTPFGSSAYYDPTTPKMSVARPGYLEKVSDVALVKSATGKYYYIIQTETSWDKGVYYIEITSEDSPYSDVTIEKGGFELI